MNVNVKDYINYEEYTSIINMVVSNCFVDGIYKPENYDVAVKSAMIMIYAPDYDFSGGTDMNYIFERIYSVEGQEIYDAIVEKNQYYPLMTAIENAVKYHYDLSTVNSDLSLSDYVLSKVIENIGNKIDKVDFGNMDKDTIQAITKAAEQVSNPNFTKNLIDGFAEKGMLKNETSESPKE